MVDKTAIQEINAQNSLKAINGYLVDKDNDVIALPEGSSLHDLTQFDSVKRWFTGRYKTTSLEGFLGYVNDNIKNGCSEIFISVEDMSACAIFDLYTIEKAPARAEHQALLKMKATPEYQAIKDLCGGVKHSVRDDKLSQREMAEWMEEWREFITPVDSSDKEINIARAINAIRGMTVEASRKMESSVGDMSESRSTLDRIDAKGKEVTVAGFIAEDIYCYSDLQPKTLKVKFSIITDAEKIAFKARMLLQDKVKEELGQDLADKINASINIDDIYLGDFNAT
jgi:uncharacterized protein YfdQ (DUF2303 family)